MVNGGMRNLVWGSQWKAAMRLVFILALVLAIGAAGVGGPAGRVRAQDDPSAAIEAAALAAHRQNLRTGNFTYWLGGNLGDPANQPRILPPLGESLARLAVPGMAGDDGLALDAVERPVLLNFWASWCAPCRLEFDHLAEIALAPDAYAYDVVFVNMADQETEALAFLDGYPPAIHTVSDASNRLNNRAGVDTIPTSLLLDADGTVLAAHVGILTPTVTDFLNQVAAHPGQGTFIAADHMEGTPGAVLDMDALAQPSALAPPVDVQGELSDAHWQDAYRFEGSAGDQVTITMKAENDELDPYLVLLDADGTRLVEADDDPPSHDARIETVLPADGAYLVVATRYLEAEGFASGPYRLTLTIKGTETPAAGGTLTYGETVTGRLTDESYAHRWSFKGQRGDRVRVVMTREQDVPGGLDGWLILEGPDGSVLAEIDDTPDRIMPVIDDFRLPDDGRYTLIATRYGQAEGLSVGNYALSLELLSQPEDTAAVALPLDDAVSLAYGEAVSGRVDDDRVEDWYVFEGSAGDVITLVMRGEPGGLDAYLMLYGPDSRALAEVDDVAMGDPDAWLQSFTLPADGRYAVRATRYGQANGPSSGAYELALSVKQD